MSFEFAAESRPTHNHALERSEGSKLIPQNLGVEPLTARELEVVRLLGAGLSNQAIAQELVVAVGTVKRHIANILSKLQVDSRLAAVARARELGLL